MDVIRYGFLVATLGEDGAQALAKAAERAPVLQAVLVPRAILAWLQNVETFEGELPGVENSYVCFSKAENAYTGTVSVGDTAYGFEAATPLQLAASIGIALGVDADTLDPSLKDVDLQRLGKSVDLLAKARKTVEDLRVAKAEPPGPAAAPQKQGKPLEALPPIKQPRQADIKADTKKPKSGITAAKTKTSIGGQADLKPDLGPQVKLTRAQAQRPCPVCAQQQFRGERLVGCLCFQDLAKSADAVRTTEGYTITFGSEWDAEGIEVFLEGLQGRARSS
jgi:hypothetical protein